MRRARVMAFLLFNQRLRGEPKKWKWEGGVWVVLVVALATYWLVGDVWLQT